MALSHCQFLRKIIPVINCVHECIRMSAEDDNFQGRVRNVYTLGFWYNLRVFMFCLVRKLLKIPKTNLKTFGECSFGYIAPTVWNSLPAELRASPSLPTFKVNLKMHFFHQGFWLICTCQPLPVSYSCMCVSWGRGWGLGEMELWVGSNIMIHFLYILLFLIWHMYLYIIHC